MPLATPLRVEAGQARAGFQGGQGLEGWQLRIGAVLLQGLRAQLEKLLLQIFALGGERIDAAGVAFHALQPFHGGAQLLLQGGGAIEGAAIFQPLQPLFQKLNFGALLAALVQDHQEQHRQQGDTLVMVTATNEFVTGPIAQAFGMDVLLAAQLVRDADGNFTGEIDGVPTLREGKVTRVNQWLQAQGLSLPEVHATFYSDSMNDLPLLENVDVPVVTNGGPALKQIAQERGWRILDLFETS